VGVKRESRTSAQWSFADATFAREASTMQRMKKYIELIVDFNYF
jgi:hypothetical protein